LLLVRHGESEGNALRRFTESDRVPLTPAGREQAARAAAFLRAHFEPARIVSSPFTRAWQTAGIIAASLALPLEVEPDLREQFLGALHGQSYDAALSTPGYDTLPRWDWRPPEGETLAEVRVRAARLIATIARASLGRDVVAVSHAGTIQSVWAEVEGSWEGVPPIPNGSIVRIAVGASGYGEPTLLEPG
jgi:broad specificity phosphatase PhoE